MNTAKLRADSALHQLSLRRVGLGCSLALGAIGLAVAATVCVAPPSGRLAWLPGDGNASDLTGNGHDGTVIGGATFGTGEVAQAFSFNGAGQYVSIPDSPGLHPSSLTAEGWFELNDLHSIQTFFGKATGNTSADSFSIYYLDGLRAQICSADNDQTNCGTITTTTSPAVGKWFHLAMSYDLASKTEVLYYNGKQIGKLTKVAAPFYGNQPLTIGADIEGGGPNYFANGGADEFTLYDRALSAGEVQGIYNAGTGGKCKGQLCETPPPGLVAWYKGDGDFSDTQGGNDAMPEGSVLFVPGKVGQAFDFGISDYVTASDSPALHSASFTAEGWFVLPHNGSSQVLMAKPGNTSADSFALYAEASGDLAAQICSADLDQNACYSPASGVAIQNGAWFQAALTYDAPSQTMTLYYNGQQAGSPVTGVPAPFYTNQPLTIGADLDNGVPNQFLQSGNADEVSIYKRALTATEIAEIYKSGSHGKCPSCAPLKSPPQAWYKAEVNANDSSGNGYNGAVQGSVGYSRGIVGQGFNFTGGSMQVAASTVGNFGTSDFAIDFWMKQDQTPIQSVISKRAVCNTDPGFDVRSNAVDSAVGSQVQGLVIELQPNAPSPGFRLDDSASVSDGVFHHVVIQRSGDTASLYVDSKLIQSKHGASALNISSSAPFALSGSPCIGVDGTKPYSGVIDEVQVFNRALSLAEIQGLYCAGGRGACGPVLTANPNPIGFGEVTMATTKTVKDKVAINGGSFSFGTPTVSGPNAADFSIDPSSTATTCTGTKTSGKTCQISVRFTPSQAKGTPEHAALVINDGSGTPRLTVPLSGSSL